MADDDRTPTDPDDDEWEADARVADEDVERAAESWRELAPERLRGLIDADEEED